MNEQLIEFLSSYGLPGVVIAALFCILFILLKQGKEEREKWLSITDERQQETNEVIRNLTAVIERNR